MTKAILKAVCPDGVWGRIRDARWRLWDAWHGVDTNQPADLGSLTVIGVNRDHGVRYEPSGSIRPTLRDLDIAFEQYGFIDLGSGKGRVLLTSAEFPFRFVIGVEFSSELHTIAQQNIRQYRRGALRCRDIRSVLGDAAEYALPPVPLVVYLFNPFTGPVLNVVIRNIRRSVDADPRDVIMICAGSWMSTEAVEAYGGVELVWCRQYSNVYRFSLAAPHASR
jgi:hypothetical protein